MNKSLPRILLIKASYISPLQGGIVHPLGIMTLASVLRNNGYTVELLDLRITKKRLQDVLNSFMPDIVGISALTTESNSMHSIAKIVKEWKNDVTVLTGGPHPTSFPAEVLRDKNIDFIVLGEGEKSLLTLLSCLTSGSMNNIMNNIKGIGYRVNGTETYSLPDQFIDNIDELPLPAWDLIEFDEYAKYKAESDMPPRKYASIFTSRGCPYRCIYCHNVFGKSFRARSPEKVLEEIKFLIEKFNTHEFEILDDIFNLDKTRLKKICDLIISQGLNIKMLFPNGLRTDLLDEESLKTLKAAGTTYISIAVETASPRLQKLIKKNLNLERVKKNIEIADKLGIITHGFFMFGFPTETRDEAMRTLNFAVTSKLTTASFFIVTPFKNTELWDLVKERLNLNTNFENLEYFKMSFNLSEMDNNTLLMIYRNAYRQFYSFRRIIRILRLFPFSIFYIKYCLYLFRRMFTTNRLIKLPPPQ